MLDGGKEWQTILLLTSLYQANHFMENTIASHDDEAKRQELGLSSQEVVWVKIGFNLFLFAVVGYLYCMGAVAYRWMGQSSSISFSQIYDAADSYVPFHWLVYIWAPLVLSFIGWRLFGKKTSRLTTKH